MIVNLILVIIIPRKLHYLSKLHQINSSPTFSVNKGNNDVYKQKCICD